MIRHVHHRAAAGRADSPAGWSLRGPSNVGRSSSIGQLGGGVAVRLFFLLAIVFFF